jgi:malate dehydrogenase (oxaloacetate-decarboxylating)
MKLDAARAIAQTIEEHSLTPDYIVPSVFDQRVVERVSEAVQDAATRTGVARKYV